MLHKKSPDKPPPINKFGHQWGIAIPPKASKDSYGNAYMKHTKYASFGTKSQTMSEEGYVVFEARLKQ